MLREPLLISLYPRSCTTGSVNIDGFVASGIKLKSHRHLLTRRYGVASQSGQKLCRTVPTLECENSSIILDLPLAERIIPNNDESLHSGHPFLCFGLITFLPAG
jgi:hypothetical protein